MAQLRKDEIKTEGLVDPLRQNEAVRLLREAGADGITREQLRTELGDVSLRTVDRAVALLEAQGARIDRVRQGWPSVMRFVLKKGPSWDEHVSPVARLALRLASMSLAQCGSLLWQDKLETIESLVTDRMSAKDRKLFRQLSQAVRVQGGVDDPIETDNVLEPTLQALDGPREMEVEYQAAVARQPTTFKVIPYALSHDLFSGGAFLLVWEPGRRIPLHLRLSRISRVKVGRPTSIPDPDLMERASRHQIGGWMSADEPFQVEARIVGAHWIQAFKEAPPALPDFEADAAKDGKGVLVRFKANHPFGATRWLMQFGAAAEVLTPASLRAEIRNQFLSAAALYDPA
jgi:predicted DNA-binding transcriptional regulator YafY